MRLSYEIDVVPTNYNFFSYKYTFLSIYRKLDMNRRKTYNNLHRWIFLDDKINHCKHNIYESRRYSIAMHDPLNSM